MKRISLHIDTQWRTPLLLVLLFVTVQLLLFFDTTRSLVEIWTRSGTYNHGFLIAPISLWLIWEKRHHLSQLDPRPAPAVLILYVGAGLAWLIANALGIQVGEQLALVSMLVLGVWVLLGDQVARVIAFPLFFLYLAVPMGEGLIAPMMEFTASFTVKLLQLTGIPVYREGLFFSLPTGNWSVVEACSGVRYLIASVTLGLLYAYLSYTRLSKRILFVIAAFVVPVIANGLRAYMIVMIGHLSGMELAVGVDHLIYGWLFFGLVMFILFWIGSFWRDPPQVAPKPSSASHVAQPMPARRWVSPVVGLLAIALLIQAGQSVLNAPGDDQLVGPFELPVAIDGWQRVESKPFNWRPRVAGTTHIQQASYEHAGHTVNVFIALYPSQSQGHEAANTANRIIENDAQGMRVTHWDQQVARLHGDALLVNAYHLLASDEQRLLVWQWYLTGDSHSADPSVAKLQQLRNMIHPGRRDGAYVAIATSRTWDGADNSEVLQQFLKQAMPEIERAVARALGQQ